MLAGTVYVLSSYATLSLMGIECSERFLPVALSFVLIALFFGILGVWVGVYKPAIQSPLVVAGLTVFTAYCLTSFSRIAGVPLIDFLSPFSFLKSDIYFRKEAIHWNISCGMYCLWRFCIFLPPEDSKARM